MCKVVLPVRTTKSLAVTGEQGYVRTRGKGKDVCSKGAYFVDVMLKESSIHCC